MRTKRLIITRPPAQASDWLQALAALGCEAQALPLIDIAPPSDPLPVLAAWRDLASRALVMFVSANAVQHFFGHKPAAATWPGGTRAGSTGPGTTAALLAAGVPAACIVEPDAAAPRFDSEALWSRLAHEDWAGRLACIVRGEEGRDWLAETLRGRGAFVDFVAAYRRLAPQPDAAGLALLAAAQAEPDAHLWVFSSSEAVANLQQLVPSADWSRSAALASHPRIADSARAVGFTTVQLVQPTAAALVAALRAAAAPGPGSSPPIQSAS